MILVYDLNMVDYAEHVAGLLAAHGIVVTERRGARGRAYARDRRIRIAPVRGPVSYAIALHEIGHVVAPMASGRQHRRIDKEVRAWRWAMSAAVEWTERMDRTMQRSLAGYVARAELRGWSVAEDVYRLLDA
jgi:hypothetical protein